MLSLIDAAKDFDPANPLGAAFAVVERSGDEPWYAPATAAQLAAKLAEDYAGESGAAHLWRQARLSVSLGEGLSRVEQIAMSAVLDMGEVEPDTALAFAEDLHERHGLIATYHAIGVAVQLIRYVAELVGDPSISNDDDRARAVLVELANEIARKKPSEKEIQPS
ncbi:hypothetical protein [Mycolicibacterium sp. XJ879]